MIHILNDRWWYEFQYCYKLAEAEKAWREYIDNAN